MELGKFAAKILGMLRKSFEDGALNWSTVFERHLHFKVGCNSFEDKHSEKNKHYLNL